MTQQKLFLLDRPVDDTSCLGIETDDTVQRMRDGKRYRRLATLVERLQRTEDPVDRAKLATEIRDLAEALIASSIRDANEAGTTWREIASRVDVPFQTLYRRYGREER